MGRKPKTFSRPSFSKVLIQDDFTTSLMLPQVFVQKYIKYLPENAKLRTSSGETWNVKLEETDDDDDKYCFTKGWNKFVNDLELKLGEFLVFRFHIGDSTFDVSVYGTHCCVREISAMDVDSDADEEDSQFLNDCRNVPDVRKKRSRSCVNPESEDAGTDSETHPRFEILLSESRKFRVFVPKLFVEATGLIGKRSVVLEHPPKQRYWSVILDHRPRPRFSFEMASGWSDFRKENGLVIGKTYSFEFDPTKNVIQVKEQKKRKTVK